MTVRLPAAMGAAGLAVLLAGCASPDDSTDDASRPAETVTVTAVASAPPTERLPETEAEAEPSPDTTTPAATPTADQGHDDDRPTASPQPSEDPSVEAGGVQRSDLTARGNIPKSIGEPALLTAPSGERALELAVTGLEADAVCTSEFAEPAENGSFIRVDLEATTGSGQALEELFMSDSLMISPYEWKFIDSSGTTANEIGTMAAYMCLADGESLPDDIGPGENVAGSLVVDVPDTSGTLVYEPLYDEPGWEWTL